MNMPAVSSTLEKPVVRPNPPGHVKISDAMRALLSEKDFGAITTADIARVSGVNESLIYKHFGDKRGLLHYVLGEALNQHLKTLEVEIKGIKGALNKLRRLVWLHINGFATDRVFARIIMVEVRNYHGYFDSESFQKVKRYSRFLQGIIEEGVANGEIRDDISVESIRRILVGGIEHLCLPGGIFGADISADKLMENISDIIFGGIEKRP